MSLHGAKQASSDEGTIIVEFQCGATRAILKEEPTPARTNQDSWEFRYCLALKRSRRLGKGLKRMFRLNFLIDVNFRVGLVHLSPPFVRFASCGLQKGDLPFKEEECPPASVVAGRNQVKFLNRPVDSGHEMARHSVPLQVRQSDLIQLLRLGFDSSEQRGERDSSAYRQSSKHGPCPPSVADLLKLDSSGASVGHQEPQVMAELRRSSAQDTESQLVSIGEYRFDGGAGQLWRGADEIKLTPRASRLLAALAERPMQVVTKKQLIDRLWNGKAVGDDALTSCVQELRRALGDDPRSPRFVETRYRRGYRLLLPVISAAIATGSALLPPLDKPSIAVLPFRNSSGNPEQEYFADGLAEDLITGLSRVSWLFVIARNSSFVFRSEKVDARTIGDRLGVRYLVEGSVRRAGPRLRLTVQLIEAATGNHLWADKYDGSLEDVFDFQDRTVVSLVGAMEPKLRAAEILRARRKRPENLDAFDLYLQAVPRLASFSAQGIAEAIGLLGRAVALSPDYAQALADAAVCRVVRPTLGHSPDSDRDLREAAELSRQALESDPTDTVALDVAAFVVVLVDRNYEVGWDLVDKALAINPNDARAWNRLGWISAWAGEFERAMTAFEKAMRLSPLDPQWGFSPKYGLASALCWDGRSEEALPWVRRALQERPEHTGIHLLFIGALWLSGRHVEAREAAQNHVEMVPRFSLSHTRKFCPARGTSGQEQYFDALREAGLPV